MKTVLNSFYKIADFKSRSSKKEMVSYVLFVILLFIMVLSLEFWRVVSDSEQSKMISLVIQDKLFLVFLISLVPLLTLSMRRLHDINKSGWFILLPLPFDIMERVLEKSSEGLSLVFLVISLGLYIYLLVLYCTDGDKKNNRFGKNIY